MGKIIDLFNFDGVYRETPPADMPKLFPAQYTGIATLEKALMEIPPNTPHGKSQVESDEMNIPSEGNQSAMKFLLNLVIVLLVIGFILFLTMPNCIQLSSNLWFCK